jgi:hypothetical protein
MRSGVNAEDVLYKAGIITLGRIKKAFVVKSGGGTDEAGERWQPLSPRTIAYRRAKRTKTERGRDARPSQALTKKQQKRWWDLYAQGMAKSQGDKAYAARRAWFILKSEGANTLINKYGSSHVDILRDTGELLNSFQVRIESGDIVISTDRKGAAAHHSGVPGCLPQRRLWPDPSKWPQSWWSSITDLIRDEIIRGLSEDIQEST